MATANVSQNKQISYVGPFITMVLLFFVVGFLTTANTQFQGPLQEGFLSEMGNFKNSFATLITFSWFLAYPVFGGVGTRWINRYGYRSTLVRGLMVMMAGMSLICCSSVYAVNLPDYNLPLGSLTVPGGFIIFLIGSFVMGGSVTILQVVINPYLTACHVPGTQAIQRLAIGGSANSIGTTVAPFFVTAIVFGGLAMEDVTIDRLLLPFMMLLFMIAIVATVLQRISLPDISDTRASDDEKLTRSVWSFRHLTLGVVAIFFYVGAEVCIGANINMYAIERGLDSPALLATIYWGGMLIGRLVGSSLSRISPRTQLTVTTLCAASLTIAAMIMSDPWILAGVGLFHSIMWGAIFSLAVKGLGKYTSAASGVFMIGVVGGAILPLLQGVLADIMGGWQMSWLIVVACELIMLSYARIGSRIKPGDIAE